MYLSCVFVKGGNKRPDSSTSLTSSTVLHLLLNNEQCLCLMIGCMKKTPKQTEEV